MTNTEILSPHITELVARSGLGSETQAAILARARSSLLAGGRADVAQWIWNAQRQDAEERRVARISRFIRDKELRPEESRTVHVFDLGEGLVFAGSSTQEKGYTVKRIKVEIVTYNDGEEPYTHAQAYVHPHTLSGKPSRRENPHWVWVDDSLVGELMEYVRAQA